MALTSDANMKSKASELIPNCARRGTRHLVLMRPLGGSSAGALKQSLAALIGVLNSPLAAAGANLGRQEGHPGAPQTTTDRTEKARASNPARTLGANI